MQLTCVRHGATAWNLEGRFQGHSDVPLSESGIAQAAAVAVRLRDEHFDTVVSSDLARATATAATIVQGRGVAARPDARWREMSFGEWEGLTWAQIEQRNGPTTLGAADFGPPGGESFAALRRRVASALASLCLTHRDGSHVLVVTHAGPIHALLAELVQSPNGPLGTKLDPASVTRFILRPRGWALDLLNSTTGPVR